MIYNGKYWEELNYEHTQLLLDSLIQNIVANIKTYSITPIQVCSVMQKLMNREYNENSYYEFRNHMFKEIEQTVNLN